MSDVLAERVSGIRIADPKPAFCAACLTSADAGLRFVRFYDLDFDGPQSRDPISSAIIEQTTSVELCENCVRGGAEALEFKPDLHQRQYREVQRREITIEYWRDRCKRVEAERDRSDERIARLEQDQGLVQPRRRKAA